MGQLFRKRAETPAGGPELLAAHDDADADEAVDPERTNPELAERLRRIDWPKAPPGAKERVLKRILPEGGRPHEPEPEPGRD